MMPGRFVRLPVLGLVLLACGYIAFIVLMLPATLLDAAFDARTVGRVRIADAQGTVWAGRGRLEVRDPNGGDAIGIGTRWKWKPSLGAPAAVSLDFGAGQGAVAIFALTSPNDVRVSHLALELPARILGLFIPGVRAARLSGDLRVESETLLLSNRGIVGSGKVRWLDAGSTLVNVWPMGSYTAGIEVGLEGGAVRAQTLKGPLRLDGNLGWSKSARPEWQLRATAPAAFRSQLEPLLRMVGQKIGDGTYLVSPP
jgi:general secretion pathway protein N